MPKTASSPAKTRTTDTLRLGYVPLVDAAPLIVAARKGIFEAHGLEVVLSREAGWATIRDKIIYGELEAAHAIAGLAFAITFGLGAIRQHCVSGFLLNANGDAITFSKELCDAGVTDAPALANYVRKYRRDRPVTLATVHAFSSHHFLMRSWLRPAGLVPGRDVQLVVIPPALVVRNLELGHIDGFCVGEPWNTVAQVQGVGRIVSTSPQIAPLHPEKALIVRKTFADLNHERHLTLIRAMNAACDWCDNPAHQGELIELLSRPEYLNTPASILSESLTGVHREAEGQDLHVFHRFGVNRPTSDKANWLLSEMRLAGLLDEVDLRKLPKSKEIFREDLYWEALGAQSGEPTNHHLLTESR